MIEILRNKSLATRFQILIEIAANQPNLQQRDIALRLGVTSQAISEYIRELVRDGWLESDGRSRYKITKEGVNWVLKTFRELRDYSSFAGRAINSITVCTAMADVDISVGQPVGLEMKYGILVASANLESRARGVAVSAAVRGEDVGISKIEGIVDLVIEKISVLRIPNVQRGGSRYTDLARLRAEISRKEDVLLGAIGIEALTALRKLDIEPRYLYGVAEAAIEAARSSLPFLVVCTEDETSTLLTRLTGAGVDYELLDLSQGQAETLAG